MTSPLHHDGASNNDMRLYYYLILMFFVAVKVDSLDPNTQGRSLIVTINRIVVSFAELFKCIAEPRLCQRSALNG